MALNLFVNIKLPSGKTYTQPTGLFINNEFVKSIKGYVIESINPATEEPICSVYGAEEEDVDLAVKAARAAFKGPNGWKKTSGADRADLLYKLSTLVNENRDVLASIEAMDSGKPKTQNSLGDIDEIISVLKYFSGHADGAQSGKTIETGPDKLAYTLHEPYGVCGQIIPWNYPLGMAGWKIGPALAAGNCIILKSAEQTPLSILYLAKLVKEAGFPPGVVNILSGLGKTAGAALAAHSDVDKIAFTGSTATGKIIMKLAANNLKAITLECGGKSPLFVFNDCDFEQSIKWAHFGIMCNMGQICSATSRIYVQEETYEKFIAAFKAECDNSSIMGDPFDDNVIHGPQVSKLQQQRILDYIKKGKAEGARLVCGGKAISPGYYVQPTIFADVTEDMTIMKEEIFGPVVCIAKFKDEEDCVNLGNDSEYGLAAAIFSSDIGRSHRLARDLDAGSVWINSDNDCDIRVPFGGYKVSGIGRELGDYGMGIYTQAKAVHVNLGCKL
ncbi:aldehyde dehydrogenase [Nadsonia fulvescens var. elongata DSM 6958]|uniref:Aldehyde dehydrogenase n=1 Tax=Nadsonia fulvescens var. elongata DSM 6958 TaxID=857566 RepID=A0A1E3PP89_9ASCO|nr:aldehyde dehydrogenase [Nadsonia fulvescens var. elongata DSM 6958]